MSVVKDLIEKENIRQSEVLRLIPSENYMSEAVKEAVGSVFSNKYSEGYAGKRYYQGNKLVDELENLAIERAKKLFGVPYANVQAYSGSIANAAVYFGLLGYNDVIMGMQLSSGGHLTHGHPKITFSGKYFRSVSYSVNEDGFLDYAHIRDLALKNKPQIIISGASAYPREIDFAKIGQIAEEVDAYHMADISHIAGLVATGVHASPVEHADIITTTTHKTLRGPRGAMILITKRGLQKDPNLDKKVDRSIFPGMQGGPHNNTTAGIAVALEEALQPEFKEYAQAVIKNAEALAAELKHRGFVPVTGGTDNHLILLDLRPQEIDAWTFAWALEYAGIIVNRNAVPHDNASPFYPSGIRLGTPAITTLGLKEEHMPQIAEWFARVTEVVNSLDSSDRQNSKVVLEASSELREIGDAVKAFIREVT